MKKIASSLIALVFMVGCGTKAPVVSVPTETYQTSICADGLVKVECVDLGVLKIPAGAFVATVLAIAAPVLERSANLKGCQFTTYPESVGKKIVVTATAACKLNGVPVQEFVTVTLSPPTSV